MFIIFIVLFFTLSLLFLFFEKKISATLLLVPLLGMQYILTPFKPKPGHPWEIVYEIVSAFTTSFQVSRLWNEEEEGERGRKREDEGGSEEE